MKKTAFVTGSTGFLGLNLIEELLKRDWCVIAFKLKSDNSPFITKLDVKIAEGNLSDYDSLVRALPFEADAFFHVAGSTSMWSKNDRQQYLINVEGTRNVVKVAFQKKAKKLIYTSSIAAYGYHNGPVNESTTSNALSCGMNYNKTKYLAEEVIKDGVKKGLPAVIINPVNIIGPYDTANWTKQFLRPIYQNKLPAIPPGRAMWCYSRDVADAHVNAVENGEIGANYLLGGVEASFKDVVNEIEKLLGKKLSTHVQSKYVLKFLTAVLMTKSKIDRKEPLLTPAKYKRAIGSITCNYDKAIRDLHYHASSLKTMIDASFVWLKKENLL
ncbi:MAG: NAD-dependent epimerase/dehydratase family protein [Bacillota bacterium]|nr:NAD-dependent epimerase/dehydratase family protein [Bacillota bacterium]